MKLIPLTQGQLAMVDDFDYRWLKKIKWSAVKRRNGYYAVNGSTPKIHMHRLLLGLGPNDKRLPDHIDRNSLNNQRSNLRIATSQQNRHNSQSNTGSISKFKGVTYCKDKKKKWKARIRIGEVKKYLGNFESEVDAAIAYNNAAKELHGEFAFLNPVPNQSA